MQRARHSEPPLQLQPLPLAAGDAGAAAGPSAGAGAPWNLPMEPQTEPPPEPKPEPPPPPPLRALHWFTSQLNLSPSCR